MHSKTLHKEGKYKKDYTHSYNYELKHDILCDSPYVQYC